MIKNFDEDMETTKAASAGSPLLPQVKTPHLEKLALISRPIEINMDDVQVAQARLRMQASRRIGEQLPELLSQPFETAVSGAPQGEGRRLP
jgi:hypothetical protein